MKIASNPSEAVRTRTTVLTLRPNTRLGYRILLTGAWPQHDDTYLARCSECHETWVLEDRCQAESKLLRHWVSRHGLDDANLPVRTPADEHGVEVFVSGLSKIR